MPGEFDPTRALYIGWSNGASSLQPFFVDLIKAAAPHTPEVVVLYEGASTANSLYADLLHADADTDKIAWAETPLDTIWMRDYGPLFVKDLNGDQRIVDPRYYWGRFQDDVLPTRLASWFDIPVSRPPIDMEGGNYQSDGAGRCITTEQTLKQNYERGYGESDVAGVFRDYMGCEQTTIVNALSGEGTGHVDMLATITGPRAVLVGEYRGNDDPYNAQLLDETAAELEDDGFVVTRIPMPTHADGAFRSYTNSLALDGAVLVPVYADDRRYEQEALQLFQASYPGRTIVPVDATDVIQWSGAVHCVTMTAAK